MSGRIIIAVAAIAVAGVCGVLSSFMGDEIMEKVNAKLPKEEQFDRLGWYWAKTSRMHREYKRLYPFGRLIQKQTLLLGVMCLCMLILVLT